MGWLISYDLTKAQQVAELVKGWSNEKGGCRFLAHSVRGNVLYAVGQNFESTKPERFEDRWIMVCLLRKDRGMGWGYKDMSESMGPNEVSCPLKYLDMAPCPNEYGQKWREGVRAYHANRKAAPKIDVGDTLRFKPGITVLGSPLVEGKVLRKVRRSYIVEVFPAHPSGACGMGCRVTRKHVAEVIKAS